MAFKETQFEDGLANYKLGEHVAIYDRYFASSGLNDTEVVIYERGVGGVWEKIRTLSGGASTEFGSSIDLYRGVLVVGSTEASAETIQIYNSSNTFSSTPEATLIPSDYGIAFSYGSSVSVFDGYIAVGVPERDSNKGAVYLYEKSGNSWQDTTEDYILLPEDASVNQFFGTSVAVNDNFLIIGAKGDNLSRGAVYVFERDDETGVWEQKQKVVASDGVSGDEFGGQVSLSDDYFAVSAELADLSVESINVGAAYMFNYSDRWNELRKITGVGESGLIANNFGHSIDLQGDYLIVGSPNAQNSGVADIFYKKRNWGHLKKIDSTSTSVSDSFGESVGIHYPYSSIGAFGYTTGSDEGRVYIYEDPPVRLRLAQEFDAVFQPSKASVYLKRSGRNSNDSWALTSDRATIIDATNFSSISGTSNKVVFDDRIADFTGNGHMVMSPDSEIVGNNFSIINYPIRNSVPGFYNVWLRYNTGSSDPSGSSTFDIDILLDGIVVKVINSTIANDEWVWLNTTLILPDTQQHILGIRLKEKDSTIDKIYIDADDDFIPEGDGPPCGTSPYVTVHMKVYESNGVFPTNSLDSYDYKTTLDEIIQDDWYNFNISTVDDIISEYGESLFLVMSSSGANSNNFVTWEIIDSDEYLPGNAGLRLTEISSNSSSVDTSLTKRLYYKAKAGNADINTDTWYMDNTKTHAHKIYSDYDPIEDV